MGKPVAMGKDWLPVPESQADWKVISDYDPKITHEKGFSFGLEQTRYSSILFPSIFNHLLPTGMSPATKSKSKDKKSGKEAQKSSSKPNGNSSMASISITSVLPLHYGRFRSIDEADLLSESEDHKEKTTNPPLKQEMIPGADNDKREKVRQKNERKHQRQKERRAQELYEKCSTYLMSRKLEALTQQLVVMGISQEHATTALMMNEGKGEEGIEKQSIQSPGNLKINITEELARITQMELQLKCTRQEIERAVVQAEGDLDRAEEVLKGTKFEDSSVPVTQNDHLTASNGYQNSDAGRSETQPQPVPPTRDDKNYNYTKSASTPEPANKMVQPMKRLQPRLDWPKPQQSATALIDKRSCHFCLLFAIIALTITLAFSEASGNEFKNPQQQQPTNREPVVATRQRPQVESMNPVPASAPTSWVPAASIEIIKSNGFIQTHNNIPSA
ncbi:unnamed protein product, partial [Thlaspi arvense]